MKSVSSRIKKTITPQNSKLKTQNSKPDFEILGPSPASIEKIRNYWRWHLILKGRNSKSLRQKAAEIIETLKDIKDVRIDVDVDPINLL
jgi:primosomal protein N' (replication factor Y)